MKKNFTYLKALFGVMLFVAGGGAVWGQGNESFNNLPDASPTQYSSREWVGDDGVTWTATKTRTDQKLNGKAACFRQAGEIKSPIYKNGIGVLTFKYNRLFTGSKERTLIIKVNNVEVDRITKIETLTVSEIQNYTKELNTEGDVQLTLTCTNTDGQIGIDDISWNSFVASSVTSPTFSQESGTYYGEQTITLSAPDADAIYYTTDGTKDPATEGTLYTTSIKISENTTIRAVAKKGTEFSNTVSAEYKIIKLVAALPFNIDFKNGFGNCVVKKISGNAEWASTATGASINGFNKGTCESWIITPALTAQDLSFTFQSGTQYAGPALTLLYSADYNPSTMNDPNQATWTDITGLAKWPAASGGSVVWLNSGEVELKGLDAPVRIAFKYVGNNNPAAMWQVTDLAVKNATPVSDITPDNIESIGVLDQALTASGDWTQDNIDMLALAISDNKVPVTSVTFTGSVVSATDEIIGMAPNCLKIFADGVTAPAAWTTNVVKLDAQGNATSEKISLDAGAAFGTPVKITAENADFLRQGLTSGNKSTLYVPFACTLPTGFAAYTYSGVEGTTVKFVPVEGTVLAANTPYLITPNTTEVNISETNVDILPEPGETPPADYSFLGTYQTIPAVGFYGFKENGFKLGIAGATVPAFRAYLKPATLPSGAPAVLGIDVTGDGTTAIDNAVLEGTTIYAADGVIRILTDRAQTINVYGIDGRLVRSESVGEGSHAIYGLAGGMYIVNNQKVIIK